MLREGAVLSAVSYKLQTLTPKILLLEARMPVLRLMTRRLECL